MLKFFPAFLHESCKCHMKIVSNCVISVESKLFGYTELFEPAADDQAWIDSIVKRVECEGRWQPASTEKMLLGSRDPGEENKGSAKVVDGVLIDEIDPGHETSLGLDDLLEQFGFSGSQRRGSTCSVINRLIDPVSENRLPLWLQSSSLPYIFGEDCLFSGQDKYYKVSDLLYDRRKEIEKHFFEKIANCFGFERTYIQYIISIMGQLIFSYSFIA